MRRVKAHFGQTVHDARVWRVVDIDSLASHWQPDIRFLTLATTMQQRQSVAQYRAAGLANVDWIDSDKLEVGDVVAVNAERSEVEVLYRESDMHHSLQLTNRCNSNCLMCSQPPTAQDDEWMIHESLEAIRHLAVSPQVLGLSGGEPLLLGPHLRTVLDAIGNKHPETRIEVLTNGRLLANMDQARPLLENLATRVTWLVPLYGHADFIHDFVVQAPGAFEQTLGGLLNLQSYRQPVQLRIVLIRPVLEVLPALCTFIGRNLPFVKEVALMACEPIGFALANRELCEVDLLDWQDTLQLAARQLSRHSVPFLFMNAPLCALSENLHAFAHRSISDWKNVYAPICESCQVKASCSGFFAWHERGWRPAKIIQIIHEEYVA